MARVCVGGQVVLGELGVHVLARARVPLYSSGSRGWPLEIGAPVAILSYGRVYDSLEECPRQMAVAVGRTFKQDDAGRRTMIPKLQVTKLDCIRRTIQEWRTDAWLIGRDGPHVFWEIAVWRWAGTSTRRRGRTQPMWSCA